MKNLVLAALAAISVVPAFAQNAESNNFAIRVGGFFPTNDQAKKTAKTWVGVGVQYTTKYGVVAEDGRSTDMAVSLDYYGRGDYRAVPIMYNYIGNLSNKLWWFAAAGASLNRFESGGTTDSNIGFAYSLGVGYKVIEGPQPIFVEGRFWGNQENKLNGFGLYAGIKF